MYKFLFLPSVKQPPLASDSVIESRFFVRFIIGVEPRDESSALIKFNLDCVVVVDGVSETLLPILSSLLLFTKPLLSFNRNKIN